MAVPGAPIRQSTLLEERVVDDSFLFSLPSILRNRLMDHSIISWFFTWESTKTGLNELTWYSPLRLPRCDNDGVRFNKYFGLGRDSGAPKKWILRGKWDSSGPSGLLMQCYLMAVSRPTRKMRLLGDWIALNMIIENDGWKVCSQKTGHLWRKIRQEPGLS